MASQMGVPLVQIAKSSSLKVAVSSGGQASAKTNPSMFSICQMSSKDIAPSSRVSSHPTKAIANRQRNTVKVLRVNFIVRILADWNGVMQGMAFNISKQSKDCDRETLVKCPIP